MKSRGHWQAVPENKTFKDLYDFIHAHSPGARADTYPPGDKILIGTNKFYYF